MFTKTADILVVATGIPNLITADMVKEGVAIIDVGINKVKDQVTGKTKLVGDVDFEGKVYALTGSSETTLLPIFYSIYLAGFQSLPCIYKQSGKQCGS